MDAFVADLSTFRLEKSFDILFSTGSLHYLNPELGDNVFTNDKHFTNPSGLHAFAVFVEKPFIPATPDAEPPAHLWKSGMLITHYHD